MTRNIACFPVRPKADGIIPAIFAMLKRTMNDRIGIIDLGTNTFHLLIAEKREGAFAILHTEKLAVGLGQGGMNEGIIQHDAQARAVVVLSAFKTIIDQHHAASVFAFGTSALRNAKNAGEVVSTIREKTGIDVSIISGDREAELIFMGVQSALDLGTEKSLVMDIGGGSVEFIIGNNIDVFWKESFEIGGQRLLEKFTLSDPITNDDIQALNRYFDNSLGSLHDALRQYHPTALVGAAGSFDTLSDVYCIRHGIKKNDHNSETPLTLRGFYEVSEDLLMKNRRDRSLTPGMIDMRVDMIVVACCMVRSLLENHPFEIIRASRYALKEGVLRFLSSANS
jgi:exopolyphosphatase / guanosine-5'-triphosphate,3'-diphosphate pyrophosphatase